jgi:hypothetical protein
VKKQNNDLLQKMAYRGLYSLNGLGRCSFNSIFVHPMFKNILAYTLILTLFTANCAQLFVYAGFELNQKYIATELCVNRDKPQMHCNGKCYLMRKLKQAEQKEKAHENENQRPVLQPGVIVEQISLNAPVFTISTCTRAELRINLPQHFISIFQPPQV